MSRVLETGNSNAHLPRKQVVVPPKRRRTRMHHKWNDKERLERVGQATDSNERKGYPVGWIPEAGKRRRTTRRGRGIAARDEEECCSM
ncbi:hypothetical protein BO83DRAFT_171633 [Aspergillus eucalypticola CBS 122712]|uniref:Uncharacterized protein n=1 Tax=Aspergillus eucalypticola (strain CBS 122712 / IBT 29274) TaxID=1448314 RepID=A0A317W6D1_ASPEC|nr:uncharacterized protein BO83DRAFT_171633 [Aspergillus eucalypticola CBS 122712]PWY81201.1 hypothetical protein BO83DRAFT_171633 [Aspergillus eucalypticola CBS 122712]